MTEARAILFDFDGVLADTMMENFGAWNHALSYHGAAIASDDFFVLEGMPVARMAAEICGITKVDPLHSPDLLRRKEEYYMAHRSFRLYPGVEDLIALLASQDIPMGIVSGGRYSRIAASAPSDFLAQFKAIVTGEHTTRGKPFPDPYLEGARQLGVDPTYCIVVENAPLGIMAAKAAGMHCIAICSTVTQYNLKDADEVVNAFGDLSQLESIASIKNPSWSFLKHNSVET